MPSSTSNSEEAPASRKQTREPAPSFRTESKVIAVLIAAMVVLELVSRHLASNPRYDRKRLLEFPAEARQISQEPGPRIILLGDSLTRNAWDIDLLKKQLAAADAGPIAISNAGMYGSMLVEWYYVLRNRYLPNLKSPAYVIVNLSPRAAENHDQHMYRLPWLAEETTWSDVPELLREDFPDTELRGEFLHAKLLETPMERWDYQTAVYWNLSRYSMEGKQWLNDGLNIASAKHPAHPGAKPSYSRLQRLMKMCQDHQVRVIVLALPVLVDYDLDPQLAIIVQSAGETFWDCRGIPGFTRESYYDGWHMSPQGSAIFINWMTTALPAKLKEIEAAHANIAVTGMNQ